MLKILLDARKLGDGGIGTYLHNLVQGLLRDPRVSLSIVLAAGKSGYYFNDKQLLQFEDKSRPYSIDELCFLGSRLNKLHLSGHYDIFHEPHYTLPCCLRIPAVVTVHDLIHISNPERWYYPGVARFLINRAITKAKKIIVVSDATKELLLENFPKAYNLSSKLRVIPNAIAENLLKDPEQWQQNIESRFGLKPGYIFALFSMLKPHKGFSDLIEAYMLANANKNLPQLVVAGKGFVGIEAENQDLFRQIENSGIKMLGQVSDTELASLYKGARVTIIPSLVEGFGLSALEAKVLGSTLLIRPLPSLKSIIDANDIVCSDMSVSSLTQALSSIQQLPAWQVKERNNELAARFSVQSVASKTIDVYQEAILQNE